MGTTGRTVSLLVLLLLAVILVGFAFRQEDRGGPAPSMPGPASGPATDPSPGRTAPSGSAGGPGQTSRSQEPAATSAPIAVLVGAGDIADCSEDDDTATADLVESIDGIVFTLGDNAYEDGTLRQFEDCYGPTWGRPSIKDRTRPVVGNHEYHTGGAAGYFEYFGPAAGSPDEGWYAYDAGSWRVYVLNSNCREIGGCRAGSRQERWLRDDLAANPRDCVVAMWHHPRFSSGAEHGNDDATEDLWRALYDARAELVLVGHEHLYERFGPQTAAGEADEQRGLVEFVVGTGGRRLYPFGEIRRNSIVRENGTFGVLKLTLEEGGYSFEFLPVAGSAFGDAGVGVCH